MMPDSMRGQIWRCRNGALAQILDVRGAFMTCRWLSSGKHFDMFADGTADMIWRIHPNDFVVQIGKFPVGLPATH